MGKWKEIKILEELSQIHNTEDLRQFLKVRADLLKKLALPIVVIFAMVFFWISGGTKEEIEIPATRVPMFKAGKALKEAVAK